MYRFVLRILWRSSRPGKAAFLKGVIKLGCTGFVELSMFGMPSNYCALLGLSLCSSLKSEEANLLGETLERFSTLLPMPVPQKLLQNRQRKRPTEISASVLLPTARCCKEKPSTFVTFSALFPPDVLLFST